MEADDVIEMQGQIRSASLVMFLIGFLVIFVTTYFLSGGITRPAHHHGCGAHAGK